MKIRLANLQDSKLLFQFFNMQDSLKWKYKTNEKLKWSKHNSWLKKILLSKNCKIWIIEDKNKDIGQVRISLNNNEADIDIYILENFRKKGIATSALEKAMAEFSKKFKFLRYKALVHQDNFQSIKLFLKVGYNYTELNKKILEKFIILVK